ncbi:MAG: transcription elongation factor Spt5 [Candidatus Aenigmarchaeota archaeon]|nr:transcription elongation factor Spt5 [Candidatus Aenigmarchaeota archaeon]
MEEENKTISHEKTETEKFIESADKPDEVAEQKPAVAEPVTTEEYGSNVYTVKTTLGRENVVMDFLSSRIRAQAIPIKAVMHPPELKGYIFVEGNLENVQRAIQGIPHIRGLINRPVELNKIQQFLVAKVVNIELNIGDIVEILTSPFKGDKARVARVDKTKNEVTLELLEAGVPIPVKVNMEFVKVLEKVGEKKE